MRIEDVALASLRPHPRNYKKHPTAQVTEIVASIREHGIYRPIVVARDGTILAGHGVAEACRALEIAIVPVTRLDIAPDSLAAIKVVVADNELTRLGESDNVALANLLEEINVAGALAGTGMDEASVANLLALTRVPDDFLGPDVTMNAVTREWVGMPECTSEDVPPFRSLTVLFTCEEDVREFAARMGQVITPLTKKLWHPRREVDHMGDVEYSTR